MTITATMIAVGSEMLGPVRLDTNSLTIATVLERHGITLLRKAVVGDVLAEIAAEIRYALEHADVLIMSGGLGPTEDDLTRDALAAALGLEVELDESIVERIEARFAARGWKMPDVNKRQANVFRGQTVLLNDRGTAPGFHIEIDGKHVWVFPGVPHELETMVANYLAPWLQQVSGARARYRRVLKLAGISESAAEEKLAPYYARYSGELLTILSSSGQIELHLSAAGSEQEARSLIAVREKALLDIFGDDVFGFDDDTMEGAVGALLTRGAETLAIAESCTGGLLGSRITDVAGSSRYFLGGALCYTAQAKINLAGVDERLIRTNGEVSEPVAIELATGIRNRFGATWGVAITGIAGPGGGTPEKPVGTVHIAVAGPKGVEHRKLLSQGPRRVIKWYSTQQALDLLRRTLLRARGPAVV